MRNDQCACQPNRPTPGYGLMLLLLIISLKAFCQSQGSVYYIASNGNDGNPGTISAPFQTLERARAAAMQLKGKDLVTIYVRGGEYYFRKIFSLNDKTWDSTRALLISSYQGEQVIFSGGVKLDAGKIGPVTDPNILRRLKPAARKNVFVTSLTDQSITDIGVMRSSGFGHPKLSSQSELFINGAPGVLARAPNSGKISIGAVDSAGGTLRDANAPTAVLHFDYPEAQNWVKDSTRNIWVSGFFNIGWADETLPVASISGNTLRLGAPTVYGVKSNVKGPNNMDRDRTAIRGFYFYNVLDELDTAGEYFIDQDRKLLYFWLPSPAAVPDLHLSVLNDPIIMVSNLSKVSFEGITFGYCRGSAVQIKNSTKINFKQDIFSNIGMDGISTSNCTSCSISSCKFAYLGASGVILDGGDRVNLIPSNNVVINSDFDHTGRTFRSFNPPVVLTGVGSTITHCYFHDLPGQAIAYQGNNHVISYNYIRDVCQEFSDVGAVATGRDPSSTGTTIANNFFENVTCQPEMMVAAIYIDDGSGGIRVRNNIFLHCGTSGTENSKFGFGAIETNGGSDNEFLNNLFINGRIGFTGGLWSDKMWNDYLNSDYIKKSTTKDVNIFSDIYQKNYPFLKDFFNPARVRNNSVRNTIAYNMQQLSIVNNNVITNLHSESNATLQTKTNLAQIAAYFKDHAYPDDVKGWADWTPFDFRLIGIQPQ